MAYMFGWLWGIFPGTITMENTDSDGDGDGEGDSNGDETRMYDWDRSDWDNQDWA